MRALLLSSPRLHGSIDTVRIPRHFTVRVLRSPSSSSLTVMEPGTQGVNDWFPDSRDGLSV